jgi:multidrug efflux pump subunit AcrA (membrane-fusion protein)
MSRTPYVSAAAGGIVAVVVAAGGLLSSSRAAAQPQGGRRQTTATIARRDFVRSVRLSGTVEAVEATTVSTPRLAGQNTQSLVITQLVKPGSMVHEGDLVVEFDRQDQLKNALDRRVELNDLEQQIKKKDAEGRAARAKDDSEISQAESALSRAKLEMVKNEMLPKIQAEKNRQALDEAEARLKQLKTTYDLKRSAADADFRILQIRRDRAENAMRQAESNADKMAIHSPISGMAVLRSIWKSSNMAEVQEGEEVRSGMPIVDIVNPAAMRVRAKVNQADINNVKVGMPVRVGLDAYPELSFTGKVSQLSPLATTSTLSPKVRSFVAIIDVHGSHPNLMPDLTASLDVEVERQPNVIVVPRDAVRYDGENTFVRVRRGSSFQDQPVTLGPINAHEVVVLSGLNEGSVVERNVGADRGSR